MAQRTPKTRSAGNVNIQVGQVNHSQIVTGYENVDATFAPQINLNLGGRARKRKTPAKSTAKPSPSPEQLALLQTLRDQFTLEELETICWELGITFDDLPARTLTGKARQLIERAAALNTLDTLIDIVRRERPQTA